MLADELGDGLQPHAQRWLERITSSSARMRQLIDDLLAFASAKEGRLDLEPVGTGQLVASIVADRVDPSGDERPSIDAGPLPTVTADPRLLRQLLDNLIGNTLKYVRHGHTAQVEITAREIEGAWELTVADHGIGVPADQRDAIFAAFSRAPGSEGYAGTGLGLAICQRIAERHDGCLRVEPNHPDGSRFILTVPVKAVPPARPGQRAGPAPEAAAFGAGRI